jgi:hypothetical protein
VNKEIITDILEVYATSFLRVAMVECISISEKSVNFYQTTRLNNVEENQSPSYSSP